MDTAKLAEYHTLVRQQTECVLKARRLRRTGGAPSDITSADTEAVQAGRLAGVALDAVVRSVTGADLTDSVMSVLDGWDRDTWEPVGSITPGGKPSALRPVGWVVSGVGDALGDPLAEKLKAKIQRTLDRLVTEGKIRVTTTKDAADFRPFGTAGTTRVYGTAAHFDAIDKYRQAQGDIAAVAAQRRAAAYEVLAGPQGALQGVSWDAYLGGADDLIRLAAEHVKRKRATGTGGAGKVDGNG